MSDIDWTKPLELMDGTPVDFLYGPDEDGDYAVVLPAGTSARLDPRGRDCERLFNSDGTHWTGRLPNIRNRTEPADIASPPPGEDQ